MHAHRSSILWIARAILGTLVVLAVAYGVLDLGLRSPSATDQLALRELSALKQTRGNGAILHLDGRTLLARCRSLSGRDLVSLSDGTRLILAGTRAVTTSSSTASLIDQISDRRPLFRLPHRPDKLIAIEADLSGSHGLYATQLSARLEQGNLTARTVSYHGRRAYAIDLSRHHPLLELIIDPATLRPLAAIYQSRAIQATSQLLGSTMPRHVHGYGC